MPLLVDHTKMNPDDWVSLQYVAGGYQLAARKLASAGLPADDAYKMAVTAFEKSESARLGARGQSDLSEAFSMSRSTILRHYGDALLRLGREKEARAVYARGVEEHIWSNPLCRPEVRRRVFWKLTYNLNSAAISNVVNTSSPATRYSLVVDFARYGRDDRLLLRAR